MALRKDRKGLLSVMDAMAFLTIMILVCAGFFAYGMFDGTDEEPLAKTIGEDFLSVELLSSDVYPTEDSQLFPIADLIAVNIATGKGDALTYVEEVLKGMVPKDSEFKATFSYGSKKATIGNGAGTPSSEYSHDVSITGDGVLKFTLSLY